MKAILIAISALLLVTPVKASDDVVETLNEANINYLYTPEKLIILKTEETADVLDTVLTELPDTLEVEVYEL